MAVPSPSLPPPFPSPSLALSLPPSPPFLLHSCDTTGPFWCWDAREKTTSLFLFRDAPPFYHTRASRKSLKIPTPSELTALRRAQRCSVPAVSRLVMETLKGVFAPSSTKLVECKKVERKNEHGVPLGCFHRTWPPAQLSISRPHAPSFFPRNLTPSWHGGARRGLGGTSPRAALGGAYCAPPTKPWKYDSPVNTNQQ